MSEFYTQKNQVLELMAVFLEHDKFILEKKIPSLVFTVLEEWYVSVIKGPFKEIHTSVLLSVGLSDTKDL